MPDVPEYFYNEDKPFAYLESLFDDKGNVKKFTKERSIVNLLDQDVVAREIEWAWAGYLPLGCLSILEGDPDCGKSTLACTLAALLTRGLPLPCDDHPYEPMRVGYISGEDSAEETLSARFRIAGGDSSRMNYYNGMTDLDDEHLSLPSDMFALEGWIVQQDLQVVFVDPLASFTDNSIDSHNNVSVRRLLAPLSKMASRTGAAIIILGHLVKQEGRKALHAGQGSVAYAAAARSVLLAAEHPDEEEGTYVLASTKCNLTAKGKRPTLGYALNEVEYQFANGKVGSQVKLEWLGEVDLTANNITQGKPKGKLTETKEAILAALELHPLSGTELWAACKAQGFAEKTFQTARKALREEGKIIGTQNPDGTWVWDMIV